MKQPNFNIRAKPFINKSNNQISFIILRKKSKKFLKQFPNIKEIKYFDLKVKGAK